MKKVYIKGEFVPSYYVKSFQQGGVHYVVVNSQREPFASNRRRVLNINDLSDQSRKEILNPVLTRKLEDYM